MNLMSRLAPTILPRQSCQVVKMRGKAYLCVVSLPNFRLMSYLCQFHANEKKQSCFTLGITGRRLVPLHTWQTADMPTHKALEEAEKEEEEEGGEGRVGAGPNGRGAHRRTTGLRTAGRGGKYN